MRINFEIPPDEDGKFSRQGGSNLPGSPLDMAGPAITQREAQCLRGDKQGDSRQLAPVSWPAGSTAVKLSVVNSAEQDPPSRSRYTPPAASALGPGILRCRGNRPALWLRQRWPPTTGNRAMRVTPRG